MAQKNRDKEYWLIPKRANLHQSIVLIKGILELNYNSKTWNPSKQDRIGSYLGKSGATNNGKNITPQSVRTLLASIPQYFGFLYIDTTTTPNTLVVTDAGKELVNIHNLDIKPMNNLKEGEANHSTIGESSFYLKQFEKLQISNPIILKDCENIFVFPLIVTYKLLLSMNYLDIEELAYILFKIKDHSEIKLAEIEIQNFRKMNYTDRVSLINIFRKTHLGNISLVQAPTVTYYIKLLIQTGLFQEFTHVLQNPNNINSETKKAIKIKDIYLEYVTRIIQNFDFNNIYDFQDNLKLWIDYIGDPSNPYLPKNIKFSNLSSLSYILNIKYNNKIIFSDLLLENSDIDIPMFKGKIYSVTCIDLFTGVTIDEKDVLIDNKIYNSSVLPYHIATQSSSPIETIESVCDEIIEHTTSTDFAPRYTQYLRTLEKISGNSYIKNKNLRGAKLEYLFFKLLLILKEKNIIDDIYWNGKVSQYGLPTPAPGGKTGKSDIVFIIDNHHILLELTTIKAKSMQWTAEGSSVPDHINIYKQSTNLNVTGLFVAPIHHERVKTGINSQLNENINMLYFTCDEFVFILKLLDKKLIKKHLLIS